MNRNCFLLLSLVTASFTQLTYGQIPFGVTAKQIVVNHTVEVNFTLGYDNSTNKLTESYEYVPGNRIGVNLDQIQYELRFWNVGQLGGTSGMLWWKKDYADAFLTIRYSIDNPGFVVGDPVENENELFKFGTPSYPIVPATGGPDVDDVIYHLTFTGGLSGEFNEKPPFRDGKQLIGRMPGNRIYFSYKDNSTYIAGKSPFGLSDLAINPFYFPSRDFSDWGKKEDLDLTLCPIRFCGISGTVEVRHGAEDTWSFAKYDMDLFNGDHIRVGEENSAILSFPDLSTYALKEATEIVITWSTEDQSKIMLIGGRIIANVKKMIKDGSMEYETSQAAMSIKGTTFVLETNQYASSVKVIEGIVSFTSKADGKTTLVANDQMVVADTSGLHDLQNVDLTAENDEWLKDKAYADSHPVKDPPIGTDTGNEVKIPHVTGLLQVYWLVIPVFFALLAAIVIIVHKRRKTREKNGSSAPFASIDNFSLPAPQPSPLPPVAQPLIPPVQSQPTQPCPKFCPQCGAPFFAGKKFCGKCGYKIHS
jgi:hypothetical protein